LSRPYQYRFGSFTILSFITSNSGFLCAAAVILARNNPATTPTVAVVAVMVQGLVQARTLGLNSSITSGLSEISSL
jgi:hypothetical protein